MAIGKSKKKRRAELLASYDQVKSGVFNFSSIRQYFLGSDTAECYQVVSDKTCQDLDMDELFMFVDRTISKVGQQYYYYVFRTLPRYGDRCARLERLITLFNEDTPRRESVLFQLARLNQREAYRITSLIYDEYVRKPSWFWVIRMLSLLSTAGVLLSFWYPQMFILLIVVLAINFVVHFWNKENIFRYSEAIPQLVILNKVAKELLKRGACLEPDDEVGASIRHIDSIGRRLSVFAWEEKLPGDLGAIVDYAIELVKTLFLIEPLLLFNVLATLDSSRRQVDRIYRFVGEIDVAISVNSLRRGLTCCTSPVFVDKEKHLSGTDVYHPLLTDYVANSVELREKSVLLTGSNMSGKTTFIRTRGINVILGQTINTCFARAFTMPRLKVYSAIRIADDIMSEKSYYFEEVLTIKNMIDVSQSGDQSLFLLDELFKGTNTVERIAAGKSILAYLNQKNNMVMISTHDLELSDYLGDSYDLYHFTELVENNTISFDYKIKTGRLKTTNAIRILELNDYPDEVVAEARRLSDQIGKTKNES